MTAPRAVDAPLDQWEFDDFVRAQAWGDGLPCVPPTRERVAAMLGDRDGDEVLGAMPPSGSAVTRALVAVNAVMAGCRPAMLPVVEAILRALLDPVFNLLGVQTTTHPVAPIAVVNGAVRAGAGLSGGAGCLGPSPAAPGNACIGRAVRLCLLNLGGAHPGTVDMATAGQPGKYTMVIAENEEASPWPALAESLGVTAASAVTVFGTTGPHNAGDHESREAANLLHTIAGVVADPGSNIWFYDNAEVLLLLCPEHAAACAAEGLSRRDVATLFCEHAVMPPGRLSVEVLDRRVRALHRDMRGGAEPGELHALSAPERVLVAVAGGAGRHSVVCPPFGNSRAVCLPVVD